jgi:hypothetical protein
MLSVAMRVARALVGLSLLSSCLDPVPRRCGGDEECVLDGTQGSCVREYCAYTDQTCGSNARFGPFSPDTWALRCTDEVPHCGVGQEGEGCPLSDVEQLYWTWDASGTDEIGHAFAHLGSGGWVVAGERVATDSRHPFVARFDDEGRLVWLDESWSTEQAGRATDCVVTSDERVVAVGFNEGMTSIGTTGWIRAYGSDGVVAWEALQESSWDDRTVGVEIARDVVVSASLVAGLVRVEARELDASMSWSHAGPIAADAPAPTCAAADGTAFVVAGTRGPPDALRAWFAEYTVTGTQTLSSTEGLMPVVESIAGVGRGVGGEIVLAGAKTGRQWLGSFGRSSIANWEHTANVGKMNAVTVDPTGDIIAVGVTMGDTERDAWVGRFGADGTLQWEVHIGTRSGFDDEAMDVAMDHDGTIHVLGTSETKRGDRDLWVRLLSP